MTDKVETLYVALQDRNDTDPYAVGAFNAVAGMVMWYPTDGVWAPNDTVLAPAFVRFDGARPIDEAEAAALIRRGIGPAGKPPFGEPIDASLATGLPTPA